MATRRQVLAGLSAAALGPRSGWAAAGAAMNGIRQLVFVNLVLGVLVFVAVLLGRVA